MKLKTLALAMFAATALQAHAGLTTLPSWNATFPNISGVVFDVNSAGGATVALGAHAYKNGVYLPNNGTDTFYANSGIYTADGETLGRANWSFDFAWSLGTNCVGCTVHLMVDKDPTAGSNFVDLFATHSAFSPLITMANYANSYNMEMNFIAPLVYDFNPFAGSSTGFELQIRDSNGGLVVASDITVNVPEPGTLALAGLALAGLAVARRKQSK